MFYTIHDMDQTVAAVLLMAILYIFYKGKYSHVSIENKYFYHLLLMAIATGIISIALNISITYTDKFSWFTVMTLRALYNIGGTYTVAGIYKFLRLFQNKKKTLLLKITDKVAFYSFVLLVIASVGNYWGGYFLYRAADGSYQEGPLFVCVSLLSVLYHLLIVLVLIVYRKEFTRDQIKAWATFFLLDIMAVVITLLIGYPTSMFAISLAMVLIQQTLVSPELVETEKAYEAARKAETEADNANKAKGQFLANMSHEIRTPINAVLGMDTMILRRSRDNEILRYAHDIQNAGKSLLALINDILDFSKIESGKMELVPTDYDFSSLVSDVSCMIKPKVAEKNLKYLVYIDKSIPCRFYGDDVRLRQILINLLTNAVKYTPSGKVSLYIRKNGNANLKPDELSLSFIVRDTGIGIKEEDIGKLAQEFIRIEESRNRNIEGTGLGINIVVSLLKLMGSELRVRSEYGKGSEFSFELIQRVTKTDPIGNIEDRINQAVAEEEYAARFIIPGTRLLVVDDNVMNRSVFMSLLSEMQCEIDEAESGEACLKLVKENKYDIIFMDHMMPKMDGIETFHHMKEYGDYINSDTPVVILTANAIIGARKEYLKEGFTDYLSKPIDADKLELLIGKLIPDSKKKPTPHKEEGVLEDSLRGLEELCNTLPKLEGMDYKGALLKVRNVNILKNSMRDFSVVAVADIKELEKLYREQVVEDEDFSEYRIKVHAMKNNAATIGATQVAGFAKALEYAARDEDADTIGRIEPVFVKLWLQLKENIEKAFGLEKTEGGDKKMIDKEALLQKISELPKAIEAGDIDKADAVIAELSQYSFEGREAVLFEELKAAVLNLDLKLCNANILQWKN